MPARGQLAPARRPLSQDARLQLRGVCRASSDRKMRKMRRPPPMEGASAEAPRLRPSRRRRRIWQRR
eukprot:1542920-Pyramimonas_sp.AAC.1